MVFVGHGVTLHGLPILGELGTGVDLFFLLSGFLIGRIYFRSLKDDTFGLWSFWQARWWRTLPPYFAAFGLYAVAMRWYSNEPVASHYLLFLQNYGGMVGFNASWSLCVEEHFYLMLPLAACTFDRLFGRRAFAWGLPIAFALPLILRLSTIALTGTLPEGWYWMTHFHCEGLIAGVWLAYLQIESPDWYAKTRRAALWLTPLIPVLLFVLPLWSSRGPFVNAWVFTFLAIGYAAWLRTMIDLKWAPTHYVGRTTQAVIYALAISSYSIYLTHSLSFAVMRDLVDHWPRGGIKTGFILGSSLVVSGVFYYLVERTSLLIRDRVMRRDTQSPGNLVLVPGTRLASG